MEVQSIHVTISKDVIPSKEDLFELYNANKWSSSGKLDDLQLAMQNSDTVVTAYHENKLIGLANAISDKVLVVYFPHLLIHPDFQKAGIGSKLIDVLLEKYEGFHQQMLVADNSAVNFYKKKGFKRATNTTSMWIYEEHDH